MGSSGSSAGVGEPRGADAQSHVPRRSGDAGGDGGPAVAGTTQGARHADGAGVAAAAEGRGEGGHVSPGGRPVQEVHREVPRLAGRPAAAGHGAGHLAPTRGAVRRRAGHHQGQGLPGRHEALGLPRNARLPRTDQDAPEDGKRSLQRDGPRLEGDQDARAHGQRPPVSSINRFYSQLCYK